MTKTTKERIVLGLEVNGVLEKTDGTNFTWGEFIHILEEHGVSYGGMARSVEVKTKEEVRA